MGKPPLIIHTIDSIDQKFGGTSSFLKSLVESLPKTMDQKIICYDSEDKISIKAAYELLLIPNNNFKERYNIKFITDLFKLSEADLFHGNGLWQLPMHQMAVSARKSNIPYIISTHGMLEPWSLGQKKLKKRIALFLYQNKDLNFASCIHATAETEMKNLRAYGIKAPIAVIPNAIDVEEFIPCGNHKSRRLKTVLFLSRIVPNKGLRELLSVWDKLPKHISDQWQLKIAGSGDDRFIQELKHDVEIKKLVNVKFVGTVYGGQKVSLYQEADLFILPTYSENFGIVVAEALACGTPVITTKGAPWKELEEFKCGWWVDRGFDSLYVAVQEATALSDDQLREMGYRGRKLIEQKYSKYVVGENMIALYNWIISGTNCPEFVNMD